MATNKRKLNRMAEVAENVRRQVQTTQQGGVQQPTAQQGALGTVKQQALNAFRQSSQYPRTGNAAAATPAPRTAMGSAASALSSRSNKAGGATQPAGFDMEAYKRIVNNMLNSAAAGYTPEQESLMAQTPYAVVQPMMKATPHLYEQQEAWEAGGGVKPPLTYDDYFRKLVAAQGGVAAKNMAIYDARVESGARPYTQAEIDAISDPNRAVSFAEGEEPSAWDVWWNVGGARDAIDNAYAMQVNDMQYMMASSAFDRVESLVNGDMPYVSTEYLNMMLEALPEIIAENNEARMATEDIISRTEAANALIAETTAGFGMQSVMDYWDAYDGEVGAVWEDYAGMYGSEAEYQADLATMVELDNLLHGTAYTPEDYAAMQPEERNEHLTRMVNQYHDIRTGEADAAGLMQEYGAYTDYPYEALMENIEAELASRDILAGYMQPVLADPDAMEKFDYIQPTGKFVTGGNAMAELYMRLNLDEGYTQYSYIMNDLAENYDQVDFRMASAMEKAVFNYFYNSGMYAEAEAYYKALEPVLMVRTRNADKLAWGYASTADWVGAVGSWVAARGANLVQPVFAAGEMLGEMLSGEENVLPNVLYDFSQTVTGAQEGYLAQLGGPTFLGKNWQQWVYGTATNGADMAVALAVGGALAPVLGMTPQAATLLLMSGQAGANEWNTLAGQGMETWVKVMKSVCTAGIEALTEQIPIDTLFGKYGKGWRRVLLSAGSEGTEEMVSELSGYGLDWLVSLISGNQNKIQARLEELEMMGVQNPEEVVWGEILTGTLAAGVGGALVGGFMGGGTEMSDFMGDYSTGRRINKNNASGVNTLMEFAGMMAEGTESRRLANTLKGKAESGKVSSRKVGELFRALIAETPGKYRTEIEEMSVPAVVEALEDTYESLGMLMEGRYSPEAIARAILSTEGDADALKKTAIGKFIITHRGTKQVAEEFTKANAPWSKQLQERREMKNIEGIAAMGDIMNVMNKPEAETTETAPTVEAVTETIEDKDVEAITGRMTPHAGLPRAVVMPSEDGGSAEGSLVRVERSGDDLSLVVSQEGQEGETTVTLGEGVNVPDSGIAQVLAYAQKRRWISEGEINDMVNLALDTQLPAASVIAAYEAGVNAGFIGAGMPSVQTIAAKLSRDQADKVAEVISMGMAVGASTAENAESVRRAAAEKRSAMLQRGSGSVTYMGKFSTMEEATASKVRQKIRGVRSRLTEEQQAAVDALWQLSRVLGVNIVLYESTGEAGTANTMANGWYDQATRDIFIDLNSGVNTFGEGAVKYTILKTAAHELTHYIERGSAQGYAQLRAAVREQLEARGENYMELVLNKVKNSRVLTDRVAAEAEVIADACEMMLTNTTAMTALASRHRGLAAKVSQFIKGFKARVARAMSGNVATSTEAFMLVNKAMQYADGLQQAWDRALLEAAEVGTDHPRVRLASSVSAATAARGIQEAAVPATDTETAVTDTTNEATTSEEPAQIAATTGTAKVVPAAVDMETISDEAEAIAAEFEDAEQGIAASALTQVASRLHTLNEAQLEDVVSEAVSQASDVFQVAKPSQAVKEAVLAHIRNIQAKARAATTQEMQTPMAEKKPAIIDDVASEATEEAVQTVEASGVTEIPAEAVGPIVADMAEAAVEAGMQVAETAATAEDAAEPLQGGVQLSERSLLDTMTEAARSAAEEAYVGTDEATRAVLAQVAEGVARVAEERVSWEVAVSEARGRQYSERNGTNEYSRTFTEQVNAWMEGTFPERDALVVSRTPMLYRQIGLGDLPMTINQEHVDYIVNGTKDADHYLGDVWLKKLPEMLEKPLAVIRSDSDPQNSVVIILSTKINGKQIIAPVYVNGTSRHNGLIIDSNNVATVFGKDNALTKLLTDALNIEMTPNNDIGVYYWNKTEARSLYRTAGLQLPGGTLQDGLIHSIFDVGADVNRKMVASQTESQQFRRWFGSSVVVNEDGSPKVMYHGTPYGGFTVFKGWQYFTEDEAYADRYHNPSASSIRGRYSPATNPQTYAVYLSVKKPFDTRIPEIREIWENEFYGSYSRTPLSDRGLPDWTDGIDLIEFIEENDYDYDGIILDEGATGGYGEEVVDRGLSVVVRSAGQIKSATDNVGTFDPENPDIRYSERRTTAPSLRETLLAMEETPDMTATEKELLAKYKKLVAEYRELERQVEAQRTLAEEAEKKHKEQNITATRDEYLKEKNRLDVLQSKLRRLETELYHAEKRNGFGSLMNRYRLMVQAFNAGSSRAQAVERLQARLEEVTRMLKDAQETGDIMDEEALEEELTHLMDIRKLRELARELKKTHHTTLREKDIRRRIAYLLAMQLNEGNRNAPAAVEDQNGRVRVNEMTPFLRELQQLVRDLNDLERIRDDATLDMFRVHVPGVVLNQSDAEEIRQAVGLQEFRRVMRAAGVSVTVDKTGNATTTTDDSLRQMPEGYYNSTFADINNPIDQWLKAYEIIKAAAGETTEDYFQQTGEEYLAGEMEELMVRIEGVSLKPGQESTIRRIINTLRNRKPGEVITMDRLVLAARQIAQAKMEANYAVTNARMTAQRAAEYYEKLENQARLMAERENLQKMNELLKGKVKDWFAERELMEERRRLMDGIRRKVHWMDIRIRRETDQRRIPEGLKPVVEEAVRIFGATNAQLKVFSAKELEGILRTYEKLKDVHGTDLHRMDDIVEDNLEDALENLRKMTETFAQTAEVEDRMERIRQRVTVMQEISDVMDMIRNAIDKADVVVIEGQEQSLQAVTQRLSEDLGSRKDYSINAAVGKVWEKVKEHARNGNLTPPMFFRLIGSSVLTELNDSLMSAQGKHARLLNAAKARLAEIKKAHNYYAWQNNAELEMTTWQGGEKHQIQLTPEEALSIWVTWKREHSDSDVLVHSQHLEEGGFNLARKERKVGKRIVYDGTPHKLSQKDFNTIDAWLTDEMKAYAEDIVKYLSTDMAELGNEVSMQLFGIRKFTEAYYFPMKVKPEQLEVSSSKGAKDPGESNRIAHFGGTKRRIDQAKKALVIGGITEVASQHINEMLLYNTFAIPIESFNKVLNQTYFEGEPLTDEERKEGSKPDPASRMTLRGLFKQKMGDDLAKYMQTYIADLNGGLSQDGRDKGLAGQFLSLYKRSAVMASLSVAIQQPSAIVRAMYLVKFKYFLPILQNKDGVNTNITKEWAQLTKYSNTALVKERGGFDMTSGRGLTEQLMGAEGDDFNFMQRQLAKVGVGFQGGAKQKAQGAARAWENAAGFLPGFMDQVTWTMMWRVVKAEVADNNRGMDTSSEAFLQLAAKRFDEVMNLTQVYDSTLVRSHNMRSKSTGMKMLTAFMAESTVTANMLLDAAATKKPQMIARAAVVFFAQAVFNAALKALWTAFRDDDEEKAWAEKYLGAIGNQLGGYSGALNPAALIPGLKDLMALADGYDVERADMAVWSDLITEFERLNSGYYDNRPAADMVQNIGGAVANLFGIPFKNVMRDVRTGVNALEQIFGPNRETTWLGLAHDASYNFVLAKDRDNEYYYNRLYEGLASGDKQDVEDVREFLGVLGKSGTTIDKGIRSVVKDKFLAGELTEEEAMEFLVKHGLADDDKEAYKYVDEWREAPAHEDEEGYTYSQYNNVYEAIDTGDMPGINAAVKELKEHGFLEDKETLKSTLRGKYRDMYRSLYKTNKTKFANLQAALVTALVASGVPRSEALEYVKGWLKDTEADKAKENKDK